MEHIVRILRLKLRKQIQLTFAIHKLTNQVVDLHLLLEAFIFLHNISMSK